MDYQKNNQKSLALDDLKYQNTPQNGAVLLAKLQQKVARLEITLRDKETELNKLQSSTKTSYVNELKIQTEIYYQEIFRLKNQLNVLQEPRVQRRLSPIEEPPDRKPSKRNPSVKREDSQPVVDKSLIRSIEKMQEENDRLSSQLVSIQAEKERLSFDFERIVNQAKEEEVPESTYIECTTQTSPRLDPPSPQPSEPSEDALSILKSQIEELQKREAAWEEERNLYKELVLNLKEDRLLFKDTSQKRQDELWGLQKELVKLQKDIGGFQVNGKPPLCKQCTNTSRLVKSSKKSSVKDTVPSRSPRAPHPSSSSTNSSTSTVKPPKGKSPSVVSTKRLPSVQKGPRRGEGSRSTPPTKSPLSSLPSSGSSSTQPSPSSSTQPSPSRTVRRSIPQPVVRRKTSSSKSNSSVKGPSSGEPSSEGMSSGPTSPSKRPPPGASPIRSPLRGRPEIAQLRRGRLSSASDPPKSRSSSAKTALSQDDERIADEILRDLDACGLDETAVARNSESGLPSSASPHSPDADADATVARISSLEDDFEEKGREDSQERQKEQTSDGCAEVFFSLLESHFNRKKQLEKMKTAERTLPEVPPPTPPPSKSSPQKSSPTKASPRGKPPSSKPTSKPPHSAPPKTSSPSKVQRSNSTPKKSPAKAPTKRPPRGAVGVIGGGDPDGGEAENLKDIDRMICLLEGHIARKAFLSLRRE